MSLAEERALRRDANAQSFQESGHYASSLASSKIIYNTNSTNPF